MRKLKLFLRRPFFAAPGPVSFLEYLPVSGDEAAALRLYENYNRSGDNMTYYALQPDGDLIAWGGAPGKLYSGYFPYFMRRKIARDVTFFTCMPYAVLYVDADHIL